MSPTASRTVFVPTSPGLPPGGSRSDTKHDLHDLRLEASYRVTQNLDFAARYGFERYDVSDFASGNVPLLNVATGAANAIFLGDSSLDYQAHRVAVPATQRF